MINKYFLAKMNIPAYLKKFLYDRYGGIEIEGIPPIIFQGNGKYLLDYRIYGASGGVGDRTKNLFDEIYTNIAVSWDAKYKSIFVGEGTFTLSTTCPKQDSGSATSLFLLSGKVSSGAYSGINGVYNNHPITVTSLDGYVTIGYRASNYDPRNYTTMLNEGTTALPYEPYGYKVPVVVSGKNLLKPDGTPTTIRGVSWSYREDGAVVGERVSSNENISDFTLINSSTFKPGSYIFSRFDTESTPGSSTYQANISINGVSHWGTGNYSFVLNEASTIRVVLRVYPNFTGTAIFKPMIRLASIQDDTYEPYHEPTTTNIYLDEPIGENESISLSDTNVDIPTIEGTNVLTVDTTVQPSKVLIRI